LTTASITFSATSAMLSGPRASAELEAAGKTMAAAAAAANAARRMEVTKSVRTPSMGLVSPGKGLGRDTAPVPTGTQVRPADKRG
jgi:hypothetical protein